VRHGGPFWTFVVTSIALFMTSLDSLVVTTALPSIRNHLHASLEGLQWTASGIGTLIAARAVQGVGAAILIPLTLTLLSVAVSPERRGVALGVWGAVGGLAIAGGPLVGGAVVEGSSWQWIFWLNVPIGVTLLPVARARLTESRGPATRLDLPGLVLASMGRSASSSVWFAAMLTAGPASPCCRRWWPAACSWRPSPPGRRGHASPCSRCSCSAAEGSR
jgi:MFS family permease